MVKMYISPPSEFSSSILFFHKSTKTSVKRRESQNSIMSKIRSRVPKFMFLRCPNSVLMPFIQKIERKQGEEGGSKFNFEKYFELGYQNLFEFLPKISLRRIYILDSSPIQAY